nr:MAG TPA: hypothetical protein [Caudoviricetes sp.]
MTECTFATKEVIQSASNIILLLFGVCLFGKRFNGLNATRIELMMSFIPSS